jgi:hypothetical protein
LKIKKAALLIILMKTLETIFMSSLDSIIR